jgi:hypothetical protein
MLKDIASVTQITCTVATVIFLVLSMRNWKMITDLYNKRINRITLIIDMILMGGNVNPVAAIVIDKIKAMDINKLPKSNKDLFGLSVAAHAELLTSMRTSLIESIKRAEGPEEKDRLEKLLSETDVIATMVSTLSQDSSPDYVESVNKTILDCRLRMANIMGEGV